MVIPEEPVSTAAARAALPTEVPIGDAAFNIAHASLLSLGLARGDLGLIARGLDDRIHQPRRESLYPRSMDLVGKAKKLGALGATISGAGPAVLFWSYFDQTGALLEALTPEVAGWADVQRVTFVAQGADVVEL